MHSGAFNCGELTLLAELVVFCGVDRRSTERLGSGGDLREHGAVSCEIASQSVCLMCQGEVFHNGTCPLFSALPVHVKAAFSHAFQLLYSAYTLAGILTGVRNTFLRYFYQVMTFFLCGPHAGKASPGGGTRVPFYLVGTQRQMIPGGSLYYTYGWSVLPLPTLDHGAC